MSSPPQWFWGPNYWSTPSIMQQPPMPIFSSIRLEIGFRWTSSSLSTKWNDWSSYSCGVWTRFKYWIDMPLICCRVCILMPLNLVVSVLMPLNLVVSVLMPLNPVVSVLMPLMLSVLMPSIFWLRFHTMSSCDLSWKYLTALHTPSSKSIINMYLFDMTNGIPHVASSIQFTSEKTRDPDQLEVGRMTRGSNGSLDPWPL